MIAQQNIIDIYIIITPQFSLEFVKEFPSFQYHGKVFQA